MWLLSVKGNLAKVWYGQMRQIATVADFRIEILDNKYDDKGKCDTYAMAISIVDFPRGAMGAPGPLARLIMRVLNAV